VGVALFANTEVDSNKLGTAFQFEERIGLGLRFNGGHEVGIRATHYSNAGIKSTNDGVESFAIHYTMPL
ncbi:acyloxyacyl hydrolase, partial [Pseudomonas brassicacearum]|uniref:acyloxyacyl hydrolase n=1 Tax=Pseudomonas brassicacearum TaxID=930166 RepID=UPI0011CDA875